MYYRIIGDIDRMFHHTKAASKIAPVSLPVLLQHGFSFCLLDNHEKAIEIFKKILELDPLFRSALEGMALVYVVQGKYDKAIKTVRKYLDLVDAEFKGGTQLGYIAALKGNKKLAQENLEIIKKREEANPNLNLSLDYAVIYAALGESDKAFYYLNKAVDEKLGAILLIKTMFPLNKLKTDIRYSELLEKIGLTP
jgi:tetratricopeptide (TPR) repeat protein